jgi:hypothetical protein
MSKYIYTFNIEKVAKITEKRQEKYTDENGVEKERTISEMVDKTIPVEILIKQPNRKQIQEAEMVFSIEMSKCIKQGVLTKAMLLNKYSDTGGLVNQKDSDELNAGYEKYGQLQIEIVNLNLKPESERTQEDKDLILSKQSELIDVRREIVERETSYLNLFNHTADTKAQNRSILWYVLSLSFYKDPSKNQVDYLPIFPGKTLEEKEEYLYSLEEKEDELYTKTYNKLASIISFWFFTGKIDKEEFDKILSGQ